MSDQKQEQLKLPMVNYQDLEIHLLTQQSMIYPDYLTSNAWCALWRRNKPGVPLSFPTVFFFAPSKYLLKELNLGLMT